jgi:glycosyltransferase involved in cell wall biosynthesis
VKIAVYDRYWATAGGGEKYAGGVASVLAADHDVTLLAHEPVDLGRLGERLALDLSGVAVEQIGSAGRVERASRAHDLLINLSYRSLDRCGARHGLYVVHFPHHPLVDVPPRHRRLVERLGPVVGGRDEPYGAGAGFHPPEVVRWWQVRWTDGDAELTVPVPAGATDQLHLLFGALLPPGAAQDVVVEVDGRPAGQVRVGASTGPQDAALPRHVAVPVRGHDDGSPVAVRLRSGTWVPADVLGGDDHRTLGVPLVGVALGRRPVAWGRALASLFATYPPRLDFLDTYDRVLANSAFTRRWIGRWWGRDSDVLYPPVTLRPPVSGGSKRPMVLSVGRFFAPERGHSKKQLEMVDAWRRLLHRPAAAAVVRREGWALHLVGGCARADRGYLEAVRTAARDLPVVLHVDAPGAELDRLYREAAVYWHAAGMGEDENAHPDRMEHFGITTVEAMSAGAVPVTFAAAGPLEAFRDGVEGFHVRSGRQLAEATERLLIDPRGRDLMAGAAVTRARSFGMEAFADRLRTVVADTVDGVG